MSKQAKVWGAKEMFLQGLIAFGRVFGASPNPMATISDQIHYTREEQIRRAKSHAKFRAQGIARRKQRQRDKS